MRKNTDNDETCVKMDICKICGWPYYNKNGHKKICQECAKTHDKATLKRYVPEAKDPVAHCLQYVIQHCPDHDAYRIGATFGELDVRIGVKGGAFPEGTIFLHRGHRLIVQGLEMVSCGREDHTRNVIELLREHGGRATLDDIYKARHYSNDKSARNALWHFMHQGKVREVEKDVYELVEIGS